MNNEFVKVNKELKAVLRERMQRKQQSDSTLFSICKLVLCPLVIITVPTVQSNIGNGELPQLLLGIMAIQKFTSSKFFFLLEISLPSGYT
jgi:hypothetical protein